MEKQEQLQMPPARAAGAEEGESRGAGNAAGRGGAAHSMPGTRLGVQTGGAGGVGSGTGTDGTANLGGGGGAGGYAAPNGSLAGNGGSGLVRVRYKFQ